MSKFFVLSWLPDNSLAAPTHQERQGEWAELPDGQCSRPSSLSDPEGSWGQPLHLQDSQAPLTGGTWGWVQRSEASKWIRL